MLVKKIDINKKKAEIWEQIDKQFEWERVHAAMKVLEWRWIFIEGGSRIPEIFEIKDTAKNLVFEVIDNIMKNERDWKVQCCGFKVEGFYSRRLPSVLISFVVTDWFSY